MNIDYKQYLIYCQALPKHSAEDAKTFFKKAFEVYKEIDEIKEQEEDKLLEILEKIPIDRYIDSEPRVNPVEFKITSHQLLKLATGIFFQNGSDKDEVQGSDAKQTIAKVGWKVAKMLLKKAIDMFQDDQYHITPFVIQFQSQFND